MAQPLPELVKKIEAGATSVRHVATELSKRIKYFEKWLNDLPGKVATTCSEQESADDNVFFDLSFKREGKEWALYFGYSDARNPESVGDSYLLRDANLEVKARAVQLFPKLLESMADSQKFLVQYVGRANAEYDEFARALGIKEGK